MRLVWVGVGGAVGSVLRYAVSLAFSGSVFPWATLVVNIVGSLFIGFVFTAFLGRWSGSLMTGLTVGVLGGFTTFSTFAWEGLTEIQSGRSAAAAAYIGASIVGGLVAAWLGYLAGRALH
ncbi:MAG TPA: CrcB family protein [Acidimicrobiia bacterium]|jgi:CrcB protein